MRYASTTFKASTKCLGSEYQSQSQDLYASSDRFRSLVSLHPEPKKDTSCNSKISSIIFANMEAHNAPHILSIPPHAFAESGLLSYVTNTVLSTWIFVVIVAICATILFLARRRKSGFIHTTGFLIVKHMKAFFEPLLGHNLPLGKSLWFVGGVFIYIFGANLYSLFLDWILAFLPGLHNYLRPINADINTTLGMAVVMIFISHLIMIRFK